MKFFISDGNRVIWPEEIKDFQVESLYQTSKDSALYGAGPLLFNGEISEFLTKNWGNAALIIIDCDSSLEIVRYHFRKFLIVETEDLEKLYFRFYDPRVLRIFLPTCSSKQLEEFFGPVDQFICEDEDPEFALYFSLRKGILITERKPISMLFPEWDNDFNQTAPIDLPDGNQEPPKPMEDLQEDKTEKRQGRKFIY